MLSNKHVFWQAFLIASVIFWLGILLGINFERSRIEEVQAFYFSSETDLFDFELSSNIVYGSGMDCKVLEEKSIIFADKIFREASKLEKYDDSNKITEELIALHRRYDLLRTSLWKDIIETNEKCPEKINVVVYLYDYIEPSLTTKATQGTMSSVLVELKKKYENEIILIPIAADTNVVSLDILRERYDLKTIPVVFVNQKNKFETIDSLKDIESVVQNFNF